VATFATRNDALLTALSAAAAAGAIWFVGVQALVLRRVCPYCMLAHACGAAAGVLVLTMGQRSTVGAAAGTAMVGGLVIGQLLWPSKTFRLEQSDSKVPPAPPEPSQPKQQRRTLTFYNGKLTLNTDEWPMIGATDAPYVVAKIFDYTCDDCRHLHDLLERVNGELRSQIAVLYVPVPLEADCNPAVWPPDLRHVNACHYARYALAVWLARPERFAAFDAWMHFGRTVPSVMSARAKASELVGSEAFTRAMGNPMLASMLNKGIALWKSISMKRLPNVALPTAVLFGRVPTVKELEDILSKQLGVDSDKAKAAAIAAGPPHAGR